MCGAKVKVGVINGNIKLFVDPGDKILGALDLNLKELTLYFLRIFMVIH